MAFRSTKRFLAALALCAAASVCVPCQSVRADDTSATYQKLSTQIGPALVTVKFILKMEAGGQMADFMGGRFGGEGREMEITGLMIESSGLVLCSNTKMSGGAMMGMLGGGITANPTDLKVLVGEDTEGLKAKLIARDTELDLCWVRIEDSKMAAGKTFPAIDLSSGATPAVGDKLFVVERLGKFFDHALVVSEGRLGGTTKKPRPLMVPSGVAGDLGMPMFTTEGKVIGISISQMPSREDAEGGDMMSMYDGGYFGSMILPAAEVMKATARGKEAAAKAPPADAKKDDDKKDGDGKKDEKK